ncbi:hypothetical protein [Flavisolibacter tropicus]|uniref:Uncharacterized protein n=1 Tax=Flavisolibacter tropicus TaxID=1492898 RepID=A0A172TVG2_9BACT|nr:hypothetical protein [Flavisolibacter tropicus]ANE51069.1 hypothetical protein SY85_11715 [Flavisolibacter tropicus]
MILSTFTISQSSTEEDRPPISYRVKEYFECFITTEVLEQKNIILKAKWNIVLAIYFIRKGKYGPDAVFLAKGSRIISAESTKIYEVLIPMQLIDAASDKQLKTIELMYEGIALFLTSTYKTVSTEFMKQL